MTINGKRDFTFNGKKYHVQDLPKQDRTEGKKYCICFVIKGFYVLAYNKIGWNIEKFASIKDAQRYVRDYDFLLDVF